MAFDRIADIVDLDRYPLHEPASATVEALLREGHARLAEDALHTLPGFVRPAAADAMALELEARVPMASRLDDARQDTRYDGTDTEGAAVEPRAFRYHQVLNHQIPNDSPLRRLYCWEPLREFLRRLMGYETFHRSECPHLALTAKIAGAGDTDGWHFDGVDVVFSVLLREPEAGGLFEYAPNLRSDTDPNHAGVAAVCAGDRSTVRSVKLTPGDLNVFQGNRSLHRVSPVEGARRRVVGLFSYDRQPGTNFGEDYIAHLRAHTPGAVLPL